MLATVGFILVIVMVALIIWGKVALPPILILLSTAAVIVLSVTGALPDVVGPLGILDALKGYIGTGANSVLNTVVLFTFAIVYFNVLSDAGMFDLIVGAVMKRMGNSVSAILLMTCFLAAISHLDGSGATTMLITIPTMLPLYKKMRVSNVILLGYVGLWSGVENMLPWTSALARVSASTGVDPYELWNALIPVQIVGFIILIASCFILGNILKKKGCGMPDDEIGRASCRERV